MEKGLTQPVCVISRGDGSTSESVSCKFMLEGWYTRKRSLAYEVLLWSALVENAMGLFFTFENEKCRYSCQTFDHSSL